jgi:ceramide glucosyltransferase
MIAAMLGLMCAGLALAGAATALLAARAVARLAVAPPAAGPSLAVSVLKPLHGAEPRLAEALAATLAQAHAAPVQVLMAVPDPADGAVPVARAVMAAHPAVPAALVVDARLHGPNRKVSQLVNMVGAARHGVLVVADADMAVPPGWLTAVTAPLADPAVGLVTCLYRGVAADAGVWSRLAGLGIDWHFLPNAALGEGLGKAEGCYGATMALRAETLAAVGGFQALAGLLADDHALGAAVRRLGLRVVVAPVLPGHVMAEPGFASLLGHELRWARTVRALNPAGYLGMGVTHALPWGVAAALLAPFGWVALAVALAARGVLAVRVDRALGYRIDPRRLALLPMRDAISFAIWAAGLARGTVVWQGRRYRMDRDGRMAETRRGE